LKQRDVTESLIGIGDSALDRAQPH